jgi:hypothetical protein
MTHQEFLRRKYDCDRRVSWRIIAWIVAFFGVLFLMVWLLPLWLPDAVVSVLVFGYLSTSLFSFTAVYRWATRRFASRFGLLCPRCHAPYYRTPMRGPIYRLAEFIRCERCGENVFDPAPDADRFSAYSVPTEDVAQFSANSLPRTAPFVRCILSKDFMCLLTALCVPVMWIVFGTGVFIDWLFELDDNIKGQVLSAAVCAIIFPLLIPGVAALLRIAQVKQLLRRGVPVRGRIVELFSRKDYIRIVYTFTFGGQTYQREALAIGTPGSTAFSPGAAVTVMVCARRPDFGVIADLYVSER